MNAFDPAVQKGEHARLAEKFERWAVVCLQAGELKWAEHFRQDARLHERMAEPERKVA